MNGLDKYQEQLGLLGRSLLFSFSEVLTPQYEDQLKELCQETGKASVSRFLKLKESLTSLNREELKTMLPCIWLSDDNEDQARVYYKNLSFEGMYLENLVNTYLYYKKIVSQYLMPESTILALTNDVNISQDLFETSSKQIFDHYSSHPDLLKTYAKGFVGSHLAADIQFVKNLKLKPEHAVLDIGGGFGHLGELMSKEQENLSYDVLDLPGMLDLFKERVFENTQSISNFNFIAADFFENEGQIPELGETKYDIIILGWILHDWNDEQCLDILNKARRHLKANGKIYILESIPTEKKERFDFLDWVIFVMADGFERDQKDYERLLDSANLTLLEINNSNFNRSTLCAVQN